MSSREVAFSIDLCDKSCADDLGTSRVGGALHASALAAASDLIPLAHSDSGADRLWCLESQSAQGASRTLRSQHERFEKHQTASGHGNERLACERGQRRRAAA